MGDSDVQDVVRSIDGFLTVLARSQARLAMAGSAAYAARLLRCETRLYEAVAAMDAAVQELDRADAAPSVPDIRGRG